MSGCNATIIDTKLKFTKAMMKGEDGNVIIIDVKKWTDYDGEQLQIITEDGMVILTSSFETKLFDDSKTDIELEDIAKALYGEDVRISYYDEDGVTLGLSK